MLFEFPIETEMKVMESLCKYHSFTVFETLEMFIRKSYFINSSKFGLIHPTYMYCLESKKTIKAVATHSGDDYVCHRL